MENSNLQTPESEIPRISGDMINVLNTIDSPIELETQKAGPIVLQMKKRPSRILILSLLLIIAVIVLVVLLVVRNNDNKGEVGQNTPTPTVINSITTTPTVVSPSPTITDNIDATRLQLDSPINNQTLSKAGETLLLKGRMQGFFEGTMNYRILDASGIVITSGTVTAPDNYGQFATFEKNITVPSFATNTSTTGKFIFYEVSMKDGAETIIGILSLKFIT